MNLLLWKNYLEDHYNLAIFDIQENGLDFWIFIDNNTGVIACCIVNVTVGKLCEIERMSILM